MSWKGRIIGAIIGIFFGFFGAIIGFAIGYFFFDRPYNERLKQNMQARAAFTGTNGHSAEHKQIIASTFCLMGYVCRGAGRINEAQIQQAEHLMDVMNLSTELRHIAIEAFNNGKSDNFDLTAECRNLSGIIGRNIAMLSYLLEIQVGVAIADEVLDQGEHERLLNIAMALGVNVRDMERLIRVRIAEQQFAAFSRRYAQQRQRYYESKGQSNYNNYGNRSYENYKQNGDEEEESAACDTHDKSNKKSDCEDCIEPEKLWSLVFLVCLRDNLAHLLNLLRSDDLIRALYIAEPLSFCLSEEVTKDDDVDHSDDEDRKECPEDDVDIFTDDRSRSGKRTTPWKTVSDTAWHDDHHRKVRKLHVHLLEERNECCCDYKDCGCSITVECDYTCGKNGYHHDLKRIALCLSDKECT